MAENSGKVAIIIALITTAGVLGAKYIEVWPTRAPPNVGNGSTGTPPVPAGPTIDGSWQDQFGSRFEIATDAGALTLTGNNADKEMAGKGTVSGRTMTVAITNTLEPGTIRCAGEIASAASIRSSCTGPDSAQFEWLLTR